MVNVLENVIQKHHDKEACKYNCEKNGKTFNHEPYHCHYFSKHPSYDKLLAKKTLTFLDYPDGAQSETDEKTEKLLELADLSSIWEEMKVEVQIGCRKYEDVVETEKSVIEL